MNATLAIVNLVSESCILYYSQVGEFTVQFLFEYALKTKWNLHNLNFKSI